MSIVTVYLSDAHISATHRAYMDTHEPALRYPAYLEDDLCDIVHYPDIMVTALAYRVREGEEHLLPGEGALTVVDVASRASVGSTDSSYIWS